MYLDDYFGAMDKTLAYIRDTQRASIQAAARLLADSLAQGGVLSVMDTGHLLQHEAHIRAGGLVGIAPFAYALEVENPMERPAPERSAQRTAELERSKVTLALAESNLRQGDVLIVNSNSGRTANVIEIALQCRTQDIHTIGLASALQMAHCEAVHPSGKKLAEVVDLFIDNGTPVGDGLLEPERNERLCPGSGMASAYIFWAIQAHAVELLQERGIQPTIYRSNHVSGQAYIDEQLKLYREKGV